MATNEYVNKVIYGGTTLIDLTGDDVSAADVITGKKFHLPSGEPSTGTVATKGTETYTPTTTAQTIAAGQYLSGAQTIAGDANLVAANIKGGVSIFGVTGAFTNDATAAATEILNTKTAYVGGAKVTGTMPNRGGVTGTISTVSGQYTIQQGYHDGSGKVSIASTEQAKIIAGNIKEGITILGVTGTLAPASGVTAQAKTATPSPTQLVVTPDEGYDYLSQVTVLAIPYTETDNTAGGKTVIIAGS